MSCPPTTIFSVPGDETCQFLHGISCIHYSLLLKLENVCSLPCLQMMAPLRPLRTITQMSLLNLLLNLLRKCHYSNHYSSLLKGHFHYSSLLSHYALDTLLMIFLYFYLNCPYFCIFCIFICIFLHIFCVFCIFSVFFCIFSAYFLLFSAYFRLQVHIY